MRNGLAHHVVHHLVLQVQLEPGFIDARHVEDVFHEVGKPDHFLADVARELLLLLIAEPLVVVREQCARAGQRRERASQVVRDGAQQRAAQAFPLHGHADVFAFVVDVFPVERDAHLRGDRLDDELVLIAQRLVRLKDVHPAQNAHRAGDAVRPRGTFLPLRILRALQRHAAASSGVLPNVDDALLQNILFARAIQKARGDLIEQLGRPLALAGRLHERAHSGHYAAGYDCRNLEKHEQHNVAGAMNQKRILWFGKQKVEQQHADERGDDAVAVAVREHGRKEHAQQEHHDDAFFSDARRVDEQGKRRRPCQQRERRARAREERICLFHPAHLLLHYTTQRVYLYIRRVISFLPPATSRCSAASNLCSALTSGMTCSSTLMPMMFTL